MNQEKQRNQDFINKENNVTEIERPKVLQIITKSNFGGAQKYVYEISTELQNRDFDVVTAFGGNGILSDKLQKEGVKTININSLTRDINIFSDFKVLMELIKIIKEEKPDIIHLHSSKIGGIGALVGRICRVPKIIFSIHGLAFNENRGWFSKFIIKKIYWLTIFLSHKSIAVSENVKEQIMNISFSFVIRDKVGVIKNRIKPVEFYSREQALDFISKKINHNLGGTKIVGTIAELHHIKGINFLIESAQKIINKNPQIIFIVFGDGEEKEKLQKQIKDLNIQNNFYLLGFVDNASKYLKALDLFVLPSLYEALALVILEAKQAELKIVASRVGGIPEAIDTYENAEMFQPRNTVDLSNKIEEMLFAKKIENKNFERFEPMIKNIIETYRS
jgi:glycosyltransferase involved in cell wall biosynthesis